MGMSITTYLKISDPTPTSSTILTTSPTFATPILLGRIAARELGVPFELHTMELGKDNREEWYLNINPLGKVPAVVCGEDVVYESLVINEYLADKFSTGAGPEGVTPLLPGTPGGRAMARIVAQRSNDLVKAYFTYLSNKDQEKETPLRESLEKELRVLDQYAAKSVEEGGKGWLCGKAGLGCMTLADMAYFPFMERISATLKPYKVWRPVACLCWLLMVIFMWVSTRTHTSVLCYEFYG
ncbi:unnamed protein product [Choristocarpus tenellus]